MTELTSDEAEAIQWWNALKQEPYDLGGLQFLSATRGYDEANDRRWVRLSLINGSGKEFTKICRNPPLAPGEEWAP